MPHCRRHVVAADMRSIQCANHTDGPIAAINALTGTAMPHHSAFANFHPALLTDDELRSALAEKWVVDFLGLRYPSKLYCNTQYMLQPRSHAIRHRLCHLMTAQQLSQLRSSPGPGVGAGGQQQPPAGSTLQMAWPVVAEEYFEYTDVLDAVHGYVHDVDSRCHDGSRLTHSAVRPFAFVELGAGYGHWTFAAHAALQQRCGGAPHQYLLVDVLDAYTSHIQALASLNSVITSTRDHSLTFHAGFVGDGRPMTAGMQDAANKNRQDFGKNMLGIRRPGKVQSNGTAESLEELFARYNMPPCVDMVDIDVQGSEYTEGGSIFAGDVNMRVVTSRVKRVHIGLHGDDQQDRALINKFKRYGWSVHWQFPQRMFKFYTDKNGNRRHKMWDHPVNDTRWGQVLFSDGVLSFVNNAALPACSKA